MLTLLPCLDFLTSAPVSPRGHGAVQAFSTGTLGPGWEVLVLIVEVWKSSRVLEDSQDTPELCLLRQAHCVTLGVKADAQMLGHHGLFLLLSNYL